MKTSAYLALLLACMTPAAAFADDDNPSLVDQVAQSLKGQSILLGVNYSQGTFKMIGVNQAAGSAELTNNGTASLILDYTSPEHVLAKYKMTYGDAVWGLNFVGTFGQQKTNYENQPGQSIIVGSNLSTQMTGDYLAGAPLLYLRLSPLYANTDSYWLFGYGIGAALYHFSGVPIVYQPNPLGGITANAFTYSTTSKIFLYQTARWQFHYGNWDAIVTVKQLGPRAVQGYNVVYTDYGFGIAYNFHF